MKPRTLCVKMKTILGKHACQEIEKTKSKHDFATLLQADGQSKEPNALPKMETLGRKKKVQFGKKKILQFVKSGMSQTDYSLVPEMA